MSEQSTCGTCIWSRFPSVTRHDAAPVGQCFESPPVALPIPMQNIAGQNQLSIQPIRPPVAFGDFCSRWKPV